MIENKYRKGGWGGKIIKNHQTLTKAMKDIHRSVISTIPLNVSEQHEKSIHIHYLVNTTHTGDEVIRRSQMGIQIYSNSTPIS